MPVIKQHHVEFTVYYNDETFESLIDELNDDGLVKISDPPPLTTSAIPIKDFVESLIKNGIKIDEPDGTHRYISPYAIKEIRW